MFSLESLKADVFSGGLEQNDYLYSDDFSGSIEASGAGSGIGGGNAGGSNGLGSGDGSSGGGGFGSIGGPTVDLGPGAPGPGIFGAVDSSAFSGATAMTAAALSLGGAPGLAAALALTAGAMHAIMGSTNDIGSAQALANFDLGQLNSFNSGPF